LQREREREQERGRERAGKRVGERDKKQACKARIEGLKENRMRK